MRTAGLYGQKLTSIERWAFIPADGVANLGVGPAHLIFESGAGLLIEGSADWTLILQQTASGDTSWRPFSGDVGTGQHIARDATNEQPFASFVGQMFTAMSSIVDERADRIGVDLSFGSDRLKLRLWEGELTT
ncbi:hypothetical protein [Nocardioides baekrokdamisoli]|uniref:hypothetical protein n=1 Tax=Nocardioides baekrokdamisoli TaxID=1804624 RepID=UPI000F79306C|nr:hypothetical protein [Nocardioides baekrokdamisoli]